MGDPLSHTVQHQLCERRPELLLRVEYVRDPLQHRLYRQHGLEHDPPPEPDPRNLEGEVHQGGALLEANHRHGQGLDGPARERGVCVCEKLTFEFKFDRC